jgi:hypothetical protein
LKNTRAGKAGMGLRYKWERDNGTCGEGMVSA